MTLQSERFGLLPDGREVRLITLMAPDGSRVRVINLGLAIVRVEVPDRDGRLGNVVLGFDRLERYVQKHPFFGVIAGRYANRIALGRFVLDGVTHQLATNNGENHLHGGVSGFDKQLWTICGLEAGPEGASVEFCRRSPDGEEGYPGNLDVTVRYTFTPDRTLRIDYRAVTDRATVLNLTNHSFFNLTGSGSILGHALRLNASRVTAVGPGLIPTGVLQSVLGTPLDFTQPTAIGARGMAGGLAVPGYDHNFVLDAAEGPGLNRAAEVFDPVSGRTLECRTDQPGVQLYTFNFAPPEGVVCADGVRFERHGAFCLETQHFPDSPNHAGFPTTVLRPGDEFRSTTTYRFGVR
jgi:aldose 1-epimerase